MSLYASVTCEGDTYLVGWSRDPSFSPLLFEGRVNKALAYDAVGAMALARPPSAVFVVPAPGLVALPASKTVMRYRRGGIWALAEDIAEDGKWVLYEDIKHLLTPVETTREPPYRVRSFWSPDKRYLVTACCSVNDMTLLDDDANIWEPTGSEEDVADPNYVDRSYGPCECGHSYTQHTKGPVPDRYCRHCPCPQWKPPQVKTAGEGEPARPPHEVEALIRAAFGAGASYADGVDAKGIEAMWQMRKGDLVPRG